MRLNATYGATGTKGMSHFPNRRLFEATAYSFEPDATMAA
jgi:hypothetical protein